MWLFIRLLAFLCITLIIPVKGSSDVEDEHSRKILGSSVVTSVSVIMNAENGSKVVFADAAGKPLPKPSLGSDIASPINLLNPDKYEFYTFDDNGDLVKRLMTKEEIHGIVASEDIDPFSSEAFPSEEYTPERRVEDVVNNVQNVLKEEIQSHKDNMNDIVFDVGQWSMILPTILGTNFEQTEKSTTSYSVTDTMITDKNITPANATTHKPVVISMETQPQDSNPWDAFIKIATSKPASSPISKRPTVLPSTTNIMFTPTSFISSHTPDLYKATSKEPSSTSVDASQTIARIRSTTARTTTQKQRPTTQKQRPSTQKQKIKITIQAKTPTTQKLKLTTAAQNKRPTTQKQRSTTQKPAMIDVLINSPSEVTSASTVNDLSQSETSSIYKFEKTENSRPMYYSSTTVNPFSGTPTTLRGISPTSNPVFLTLADSTLKSGVSKPAAFMTSPITSKPTNAPYKLTTASGNKIYPTNEKLTSYVLVNTLESKSTESQTNMVGSTNKILPTTEATMQTTNLPTSQFSMTETETVKYETPSTVVSNEDLQTTTTPEDAKMNDSLKSNIKESIEIEIPMKETTTERIDTKSTHTDVDMPTTTIDNFKTISESTSTSTSTTDSATSSTELVSEETTSMSMITKIAASEILNQLLLTTNNIYELNKELSEKTTELVPNDGERLETSTPTPTTTNLSDSPVETNTYLSSTTETSTSTSTYVTGTDSDDTTSEYQSVINEAEKIMSQTNNYEELTTNANTLIKINSTLNSSANKTMSQVMSEAATVASNILTGQAEDAATTEFVISKKETAMISDSVEQLLSQILDTEAVGLTTTEYTTTNSPNITTLSFDKERDEELITSTTNGLSVPEMKTIDDERMTTQTEFMSTTTTSTSTITDSEISTTNAPSPSTTENTTEDFTTRNYQSTLPFIETLNRDGSDEEIILAVKISDARRNLTKPAKADTSLEYDFLENFESLKNTNAQSNHNDENMQKEIPETIYESNTEMYLTTTTIHEEASTTGRLTTEKDVEPEPELQSTTNVPAVVYETTKYTEPSSLFVTQTDDMGSMTSNKNQVKSKDPMTGYDMEATEDTSKYFTTEKPLTTEMDYKTTAKQEDSDEVSWTLVSTISPHNDRAPSENPIQKPTLPVTSIVEPPRPVELVPKPLQGFGLEDSTIGLEPDIIKFVELSNELAFGFWKSVTNGISKARSVVTSPFAATSLLAMVFLGARGSTSGEMNDILKLDDMVTFNPHLVFKDVSESIEVGKKSGVATAVILRELYSDRAKGKLLGFYKERVKQFYDGHVEEVSFREIGDIIRRRTNLLIKKQTNNKITEFLKNNNVAVKPPLAAVGVSVYHSDCSEASTSGRDGELHFVVLPSIRQRRLVPIPAVVYKDGFLAGYEASLDATAVSLGTKEQPTSIIFIIPGQQGIAAPGDGLARLEKRLIESAFKNGAWSRLLRSLIPRPGLEVQIPRFSHRSIINATVALKKMGLKDLFDPKKADLKGLNGVAHDIHLSDMLQINSFATCGENRIGNTHHSEIYPATGLLRTFRKSKILQQYQMETKPFYDDLEEPRDYQRAFHDPLHDPSYLNLPLSLRPRQARVPETPRLRFDRPFLYVVRHNPTGLIIHMGRFNPRLLP